MLPAIDALFDRIIANRLNLWLGVNSEQSAFQKGKSTLHQLFTLRLLIAIALKTNSTLYIGFFDLEKAFDNVSRYLLLKSFVTLGIGSCMIEALKRLYSLTLCVLCLGSQTSRKVRNYTGIRQGASSSTRLFIIFIDGLNILKARCIEEPLIGILHCLLLADDTAIISTNRTNFRDKCNVMLEYFKLYIYIYIYIYILKICLPFFGKQSLNLRTKLSNCRLSLIRTTD